MSAADRLTTQQIDSDVPGGYPDQTSEAPAEDIPLAQQSLGQAVFLRRAEYTRSRSLKIKVASWNVAALKGAEKDIGEWLVGGKGISETLSGLGILDNPEDEGKIHLEDREEVEEQEARRSKRTSTVPKGDPGLVVGGEEIGIYAVGLQEVVDISSAAEALRPYTDPSAAKKYKEAVERRLPPGYVLVAEQQLIGMLLLIYAAPDVAPEVKAVSTTSVGTGLMGYMGNKGAVTARIILGETTRLVFVNCHLAAGADATAVERRNWDAGQIISRTRFDPIIDALGMQQERGEVIGDEDFAFWFGDLNYRLQGLPADDIRRLLTLHARNEYDLSQRHSKQLEAQLSDASAHAASISSGGYVSSAEANGSVNADTGDTSGDEATLPDELNPASLQATLDGLLPHDELFEQMKRRKAFHDGWKEGSIKFMPTYKYDVGSVGVFDSSEKRRCPSWCDRILYRTRRDKLAYDNKVREEQESKQRDEQLKQSGVDQEAEDEAIMFEYNPEADGDDYDESADAQESLAVITKEGFEDEIRLETYTSHQRVLSSDHKPLAAVFSLKYDAVVPELRMKVHQEVAKDLDRAENEGRPNITLIVDRSHGPPDAGGDTQTTASGAGTYEGLDFGKIQYAEVQRKGITIANTGQAPATVSFVNRPVGADQLEGPMPPWLSAKFDRAANGVPSSAKDSLITTTAKDMRFTLEPGEASTAMLSLLVDDVELVKSLNEGSSSLEDILVLRVEEGRDHFLPVRARWLQSSLGRSIDKLVRIPEGGIRRLQGQQPSSLDGHHTTANLKPDSAAGTDTVKWSAPRELFRLTEAVENLAQRCVADWEKQHPASIDVAPPLPPRPSISSANEHNEAPPLPPRPDAAQLETPRKASVAATDAIPRAKPPWEAHSGWPFWLDSWSNIDSGLRETAMHAIFEALDTDKPFDELIDPSTPNFPRLEAVAGALVTFLSSMTDGVITTEMWTKLEADVIARETEKHDKAPNEDIAEDRKSRLLEIVSDTPAHNVSFVLVTTMLQRLVAELTASDHRLTVSPWGHKQEHGSPSSASFMARGIPIPFTRRRALSRASEDEAEKAEKAVKTRKALRERAYAVTFAGSLVRLPHIEGMKDKERKARDDRRIGVLEVFLKDEA